MPKKIATSLFWPLAITLAAALAPAGASAQDKAPVKTPEPLASITLDMNGDGVLDRALLLEDPAVRSVDLYIYLGAGDAPLDPARKPDIVRKDLGQSFNVELKSRPAGKLAALDVISTYGGSNAFENRVSILYRQGAFFVSGYKLDWDTRQGIGACDVNYLTGKATISKGLNGPRKALKGKFPLQKLADWTPDKVAAACGQ